jgi:hypothetical protein
MRGKSGIRYEMSIVNPNNAKKLQKFLESKELAFINPTEKTIQCAPEVMKMLQDNHAKIFDTASQKVVDFIVTSEQDYNDLSDLFIKRAGESAAETEESSKKQAAPDTFIGPPERRKEPVAARGSSQPASSPKTPPRVKEPESMTGSTGVGTQDVAQKAKRREEQQATRQKEDKVKAQEHARDLKHRAQGREGVQRPPSEDTKP